MRDAEENIAPVKAKAILVDPVFLTVLWMDESAQKDIPGNGAGGPPGIPVEKAVPMARVLSLDEALREVSRTGRARHLRKKLVTTSKGGLDFAASVYRLPDGKLLLLMEQDFRARRPGDPSPR